MTDIHTIQNKYIRVDISTLGAELQRIFSKSNGLDYLWNGNPAHWAKRSPVLFPIVGTLKNNTYNYNGQSFSLTRHGFAREKDFAVTAATDSMITFTLTSDEDTAGVYPFPFRFDISYTIDSSTLSTRYTILNTGKSEMLFSIGGHPAFRVPIEENQAYEDYHLEFAETENAARWLISPEGLISGKTEAVLTDDRRLPLTRELFHRDALVFKDLKSSSIRLQGKGPHGLEFTFNDFPYLGIWAAKNADFVCIEPWCGIADSAEHNQTLQDKEGIIKLAVAQTFEREWTVRVF